MVEHTKSHRVQWGETDAAAILFYPNYFRWFDQATHDLFRSIGYSVSDMHERGFTIPIVEARGRFVSALAYDDELQITSRVTEARTRAFRVEHRVTKEARLVCEGYEVRMWVRISPGSGRLEGHRIPDDLRARLGT